MMGAYSVARRIHPTRRFTTWYLEINGTHSKRADNVTNSAILYGILVINVLKCKFPQCLGARGLICPPGKAGIKGFTNNGDGSCTSEVEVNNDKTAAYMTCGQSNSYLPMVFNAFENTALQDKAQQGVNGEPLAGMWLAMTCTGHVLTNCTWDDGSPLRRFESYYNWQLGHPNATIGACVYQDGKTGKWRSQVCSDVISSHPSGGNIGYYCKFMPTNQVGMCKPPLLMTPQPLFTTPQIFRGNCYSIYDVKSATGGENICKEDCSYTVSIHSEGENSFVRDILLQAGNTSTYSCYPRTSAYLGVRGKLWTDGTNVDYNNYVTAPPSGSNNCAFMAINSSVGTCTPPGEHSTYGSGYWFTDTCTQTQSKYLICKKARLNNCDRKAYDPFPTESPPLCHTSTQYLQGTNGTIYAPGYPYYPYGQQPNTCTYIQKVDQGHRPTMAVKYEIPSNFQPNSISKFDFYSSEDPYDTPFYSYNGSLQQLPPVTSPTNILRAVYTTNGDPNHVYDWSYLYYETKS